MEASYNNPYHARSFWGRVKVGWKPTDVLPKSKHGFPIMPIGAGEYTPHYNRLVHGPYYHFRHYGEPKMSLWHTRISDLKEWFQAADKSPRGIKDWYTRVQSMHLARVISFKPPYFTRFRLILITGMVLGYLNKYRYLRWDRHYKYH